MSKNHQHHLLFGKRNYTFILIGLALIVVGCILMMGGTHPDPMVYPEEEIYGFRRTILAPFLILAGFGMQVVAIFVKSEDQEAKLAQLDD